jgi:hypothetical protein
LKIADEEAAQTFFGDIPLNGSMLIPDKKDLTF